MKMEQEVTEYVNKTSSQIRRMAHALERSMNEIVVEFEQLNPNSTRGELAGLRARIIAHVEICTRTNVKSMVGPALRRLPTIQFEIDRIKKVSQIAEDLADRIQQVIDKYAA